MRAWILTKMIALCGLALGYRDGTDSQEEVNEVVKMRNYFIRELEKINTQ